GDVGGEVISTSRIEPGDQGAGILNFTGAVDQLVQGALEIEIGGDDNSNPNSPQYDALLIDGNSSLQGMLELKLINGFEPTNEDMFTILTGSTLVTDFTNVLASGRIRMDDASGSFIISTQGDDIVLSDFLPLLAGDYNLDGVVDAADYTVWRDTLNSTTNLYADGNNDRVVDVLDYAVWRNNFGMSQAELVEAGLVVPEPGSLILLLGGGLLLRRQRYRA
ncbi:MAG: PEP-CTERM sorting domain-containing protein, partial [Rhodospirillales bacterium]|nr:PEP-CTERM sorting domain-containing protein [Rhodospirillales bacterium]